MNLFETLVMKSVLIVYESMFYCRQMSKKGVIFNMESEDALRYEIGTLRKEIGKLQDSAKRSKDSQCAQLAEITALKAQLNQATQAGVAVESESDKIKELSIINRQLEAELRKKKEELKESKMLVSRLRATKELMSAELAIDDKKIKAMVNTLANLESQIEIKGKNETERSHLYNQLKKAFIEKCNMERSKSPQSKTSGNTVETKIDSLLSNIRVNLSFPDEDVEEVYTSRAQDKVVSLVTKAKNIIRTVGDRPPPAQQEEETEEEELCIRIKRRRTAGPDKYILKSIHQEPHQVDVASDQVIMDETPSQDAQDEEFTQNISQILEELRASTGP